MRPILQSWLVRQCESGAQSTRGTLWVRKSNDAQPELAAVHPAVKGKMSSALDRHRTAAETALAADRPLVQACEGVDLLVAPGIIGGLPVAAVIEQSNASPREQASALDVLSRAVGWLDWTLHLQSAPPQSSPSQTPAGRGPGAERTLDLLAISLEPRPVAATSLALTTELATLLGCERVSLGRFDGETLVLDAISNTGQLDTRSRLARDIVSAMQEAIDQDAIVVHPAPKGETPLAASAHRHLADEQGLAEIWSLPLRDDDALTGALLVEFAKGRGPRAATRDWLEQLASLLAPVLGLLRRDQAGLGERVHGLLREDLPRAMGLDRVNVWIGIGVAALMVLSLALLPATHRLSAPAELEGIVQRAIVAPMSAYVAESRHRAGDVVKKGDVLGVLEDSDLRLEARKWTAKRDQRRKELRAALADRDRSQVRILKAQVEQAEAELELISEQRRRARLIAPFDGVVTRGDLSQALGSPVERGDVLFEVAPKDDHRVILEVDGRDIAFVETGQGGRLTLKALPGDAMDFKIRRVTPISSSEDGRSFFRVEAALAHGGSGLRPGMEGVAKIDVGERSLLWIWTHSALDWLRMAWWAWVP